jgi:hypothetical protein
MEGNEETRLTLLDEIVSMLSESIQTVDPEVIARTRVMQSTYFKGMDASELSAIRQRLSDYTKGEKRATANLLLVAEREANKSYSNWINGGADSNMPLHVVRTTVFAARSMLKLEVPYQEPNRVARFIFTLFASDEKESAEAFIGRFIAEEVTRSKDPSYDLAHLTWIGENESRLLPFVDHFRHIGSMDRAACDSVLNGASALHTGAL